MSNLANTAPIQEETVAQAIQGVERAIGRSAEVLAKQASPDASAIASLAVAVRECTTARDTLAHSQGRVLAENVAVGKDLVAMTRPLFEAFANDLKADLEEKSRTREETRAARANDKVS